MSWIANFLSVFLGLLFVSSAYSADSQLSSFVIGADVSHLPQLEAAGAHFYDQNKPDDLLVILKRNGVNTIRIKVWNEPGKYAKFPADQSDSTGFNNPEHAVALAKRASQLGFRIMIDFHYSDWWADPGKQHMPIAWQGKSTAQVSKSLFQFTLSVLRKLKQEGVTPEWVQVGNEISNGMLWPLGRTSEWDNLALFLKSGSQAVKTVFPNSKVVLHLDAGGDNERCRRWFTEAVRHDVPFDVIGLSYYPIWHGAMNALADNMSDLSQRFDRPVMVVETAYPWTKDEGDSQPNIYKQTGPEPWPMTPEGQTAFLSKLMQTVKQVPQHKGLGFIYWEPDFIPAAGAGWKKGAGDEWDNVTLFDFHGNALPALHALKQEAAHE
jgi:arabinogalactan endo-1,4-beta-galactosidase